VTPAANRATAARDVTAFHESLPGYRPTRLLDADVLRRELGLGRVWVKDEGARLGLPAFKILGASWATRCAVDDLAGGAPSSSLSALRAKLEGSPITALAAATDGNHGRAVAHVAGWLGLAARIYVPAGTTAARIDAIRGEGAEVQVVAGTYDETVERCTQEAAPATVVISDTPTRDGAGEQTAAWVIEGYSTIPREIDSRLRELEAPPPDVVVVQLGTGGLTAAFARHAARHSGRHRPTLVAVEPDGAACALESMRAGHIVTIPVGPDASIMAGLNCGTPSSVAWPSLVDGVDRFVSVSDERAREAMRAFARSGVEAGETGAAGLAGLLDLVGDRQSSLPRPQALDDRTSVLLVCTEGPTDAVAYERVLASN
jgi:diaminopropionate ammonia-lyase